MIVKTEARQPLGARQTNGANLNGRPIAPVPHRATSRPTSTFAPVKQEIEDEMDIDRSTVVVPSAHVKVETTDLVLDVSDGAEELDEEEEDEEDEEADLHDWTVLSPDAQDQATMELESIRAVFKDDIDLFDTTMVAEYADDIFAHMEEMEKSVMPNPNYMEHQTEIEW